MSNNYWFIALSACFERTKISKFEFEYSTTAVNIPEELATNAISGGAKHLDVDDHHEGERQVEGTDRGEDCIDKVLVDYTLSNQIWVAVRGVGDEERGCWDDHRAAPAGPDHGEDATGGPMVDVV